MEVAWAAVPGLLCVCGTVATLGHDVFEPVPLSRALSVQNLMGV